MNQNFKLAMVILFAFTLSFSLLLLVLNNAEPQLVSHDFQKEFYFQDFDPKIKKIFLIGSSEVHRLNATYIENHISKHVDNYKVYNIAIHSDTPQRRIASLDYIVSSEPYMIVYGTGTRDYNSPRPVATSDSLPDNALPNPPKIFELTSEIEKFIPYDFTATQTPKIHILRLIRDSIDLRTPEVTLDMLKTNTPFMKYGKDWYSVQTEKELEIFYQQHIWFGIKQPNSDKSVLALNQILYSLNEKNIKTILVTNPSPRGELEMIGSSDLKIFEKTLQDIADNNSINLTFLHEKYADQPIFQGGNHVTLNPVGLIYSEDIANIILKELES